MRSADHVYRSWNVSGKLGEPASDQGASGVVFTPASFDVDAGVLFTLGTLTLENRQLFDGTFPNYFSLVITYHLSDQVSKQPLRMLQVSTPNVGDLVRDADWVSLFPDLAEMAFFVYEDKSESVRLLTAFEPALPPEACLRPNRRRKCICSGFNLARFLGQTGLSVRFLYRSRVPG